VVAFVVAVALTYERFTLSRVSYTLIFHFPCLHEVRARLLELLPAARPRHHPPVPRRKSRLLRTNNPSEIRTGKRVLQQFGHKRTLVAPPR
jgi:hypothetical protein